MQSKRLLYSILLMLCVGFTGSAQRMYAPKFYLGGHAGATLSQMSFNPSVKQGILPGFMAGIVAKYTEENLFGIVAELNVQQRGWKENLDDSPYRYSRTLTYLQLPFMTHIYFGSPRIKGFVNLGPEAAVLLGSSINANFDYHNISAIPDFPRHNRTTEQMGMEITGRFDYGICAGAGMEVALSRRHSMMVEARFDYCIGNIFPSSKSDYFNSSRGWSVEVTAGYMFRVK